jgi:hypothetical protein
MDKEAAGTPDRLNALLAILRCPRSRTPLHIEGEEVVSEAGYRYPVIAGKPVLVAHVEPIHVTPPPANIISQNAARHEPARVDGWQVHFGSGNVSRDDPFVISIDVVPLPNVEVIAEAEALPFADNAIAYLISGAVFEHLCDPLKAIREVRRVLREGGGFYIDTAFMQGYHGFPGHYFNMTPQAIETFLLDDFEREHALVPLPGSPIYSIEDTLRRLLEALPASERSSLLSMSIEKFLDECSNRLRSPQWFALLPEHTRRSLAASFVVAGRKPDGYNNRAIADQDYIRSYKAELLYGSGWSHSTTL